MIYWITGQNVSWFDQECFLRMTFLLWLKNPKKTMKNQTDFRDSQVKRFPGLAMILFRVWLFLVWLGNLKCGGNKEKPNFTFLEFRAKMFHGLATNLFREWFFLIWPGSFKLGESNEISKCGETAKNQTLTFGIPVPKCFLV